MSDGPDLDNRCGTCARFVRAIEVADDKGEIRRRGECLGVWSGPIWETNTCSQYVRRGTFTGNPKPRRAARPRSLRSTSHVSAGRAPIDFELPEELLDMNTDEFREILREVLRDELGVSDVPLGSRWEGGEVILKPGKEGTQEKRIPIETIFSKIVMIRDKLRVLEQKVNAHPKLTPEDKVQMHQYITSCYGSLTTFNVLFADKADTFVGQKGDV
ncbi:MAG: hypothetical protein FWD69_01140 [Polyangiaceae bacterium]|nr:hypothetical protein [Polyangiaceae bacterium]